MIEVGLPTRELLDSIKVEKRFMKYFASVPLTHDTVFFLQIQDGKWQTTRQVFLLKCSRTGN